MVTRIVTSIRFSTMGSLCKPAPGFAATFSPGNGVRERKVGSMARTCFQVGSVVKDKRFGEVWWIGRYHQWVFKEGKRARDHQEKKLGLVRDMTYAQAKRAFQPTIDEVNRQTHPLAATTWASFVASWLEDVLPMLDKSTQAMYRSEIKNYLLPAFAEKQLREVDGEAVQRFVTKQTENGAKSRRIKNWVGILQSIWATAKSRGKVSHDPFDRLYLPALETPEQRCFTDAEVRALLVNAQGQMRMMVWMFAEPGPRFEEVTAFLRTNVDYSQGDQAVVKVTQTVWNGHIKQRGKTKNAMRTFTLSPEFTAELKAYDATLTGDLLFPNSAGKPIWYSTFRKRLLELAALAGVENAQSKAFRHHHATKLDRMKAPSAVITGRLGHHSVEFTRAKYTRREMPDDFALSRKLGREYVQ
jgi:site-specific recombinase XerD